MQNPTRGQLSAEPWQATALRNGTVALAIGMGVGLYQRRVAAVPVTTLIALWFTLGGHFVEVLARKALQYRVHELAAARVFARLVCWFAGGSVLYAGALATRAVLTGRDALPWPWWTGGVFFIGLELLVHVFLYMRGQPSFYDRRG